MTLTSLLGIERPIIQAPMAGSQDSALAIAVCEAGGLGSLPCAMLAADDIRREVSAIRARTARPFNLNFFCHTEPAVDAERELAWHAVLRPYYEEFGVDASAAVAGASRRPFSEESAALIEELRPPIVSFHFGLPDDSSLARVRASGAKILSSATTVDEARWLEARGVDGIIAQGVEAGGHRGMFLTGDASTQVGSFALIPQVVSAVRVPVIAAGGIGDVRGVAAAHALGALGVQVGTAYLLCPEAKPSAVHRAALASSGAASTAITNLITGRPARGIVNRLMRELGPMSAAVPSFPLAASAIAPLRAKAESMGSGAFSPLWAGQMASLCRAVSAAEVTRSLVA